LFPNFYFFISIFGSDSMHFFASKCCCNCLLFSISWITELSGLELKSPQIIKGVYWQFNLLSYKKHAIFLSNQNVWPYFTKSNAGFQWIWVLATTNSFEVPLCYNKQILPTFPFLKNLPCYPYLSARSSWLISLY